MIVLMLSGLIGACTSVTLPPTASEPVWSGTLRPYPSDTATPSPIPTGYKTPTHTPSPTPTFTPVYYTIGEQDDMFGVSLRYGISLESLKTANPSVNPYAMGVGTTLLIPITPTIGLPPTQTPAAPEAAQTPITQNESLQTDCYPDGAGGIVCFAVFKNTAAEPLENVSAMVTLTDSENGTARSQIAIMPLNILQAGAAMPLITTFQPPTPEAFLVSAALDYSLPVPEGDDRYLATSIEKNTYTPAPDGRSALVSGQVRFPETTVGVKSLWVLAVAYSPDGKVVGVRRWEAQPPIAFDAIIPFSMTVYSMQGQIADITLFAEARPSNP